MTVKLSELESAIAAMSEPPWVFRAPEAPAGAVDIWSKRAPDDLEIDNDAIAEWVQECNGTFNATGICKLRNSATALLAIAKAAKKLQSEGWDFRSATMDELLAALREVEL